MELPATLDSSSLKQRRVRRAPTTAPQIRHLFISPGHNYFGHHEQPPGRHPVLERDEIECVADRGIRGDRFFDYKENYKGQITFFSQEIFERLRHELGLPDAHPSGTRRNVITSGLALNSLVGQEFEIQGIRFLGVEECRPCYWMNQAFIRAGVEDWLRGHGGLRARILTGGRLRVDTPPKWSQPALPVAAATFA